MQKHGGRHRFKPGIQVKVDGKQKTIKNYTHVMQIVGHDSVRKVFLVNHSTKGGVQPIEISLPTIFAKNDQTSIFTYFDIFEPNFSSGGNN